MTISDNRGHRCLTESTSMSRVDSIWASLSTICVGHMWRLILTIHGSETDSSRSGCISTIRTSCGTALGPRQRSPMTFSSPNASKHFTVGSKGYWATIKRQIIDRGHWLGWPQPPESSARSLCGGQVLPLATPRIRPPLEHVARWPCRCEPSSPHRSSRIDQAASRWLAARGPGGSRRRPCPLRLGARRRPRR